jgi:succinoglycan biosynthesis protein ExoV
VILYHWRGASSNFGDELNTLLWPALLPDFFDNDPDARFLGIGSIMDRRHGGPSLKVVAGSGYGGYEGRPRLGPSWVIHWVRGPYTARFLGLDPQLGLGDPAALVPQALGIRRGLGLDIGFIPHFESAARGAWGQAADLAGVRMIDPRDKPEHILAAMTTCRLIISEALHGIIVADALRIPWIPVRPLVRIHRRKWFDWSATLGVKPRFAILPASSRREWLETGPLGRSALTRPWRRSDGQAAMSPRTLRAAAALSRLTETEPQLSDDTALESCQSRQREALLRLQRAPMRAMAAMPIAAHWQARLYGGSGLPFSSPDLLVC